MAPKDRTCYKRDSEQRKQREKIAKLAANASVTVAQLAVDLAKEARIIYRKRNTSRAEFVLVARKRARQAAKTAKRALKSAHLAASLALGVLLDASEIPKTNKVSLESENSEIQQALPNVAGFLKNLQTKITFYLGLLINLFGGPPDVVPRSSSPSPPIPSSQSPVNLSTESTGGPSKPKPKPKPRPRPGPPGRPGRKPRPRPPPNPHGPYPQGPYRPIPIHPGMRPWPGGRRPYRGPNSDSDTDDDDDEDEDEDDFNIGEPIGGDIFGEKQKLKIAMLMKQNEIKNF
ncbi:uncharacterized protein LOC141851641 [Brevipalpus obovatus]|uniref:uncharacterized protein LOC141851641 n=1 Tax=Brevipalpus obovatus TaxID=246614 RepID=UPI003D9EF090